MAKILFIDIKQDKNGRDYKAVKLDEPILGKDRFNVFGRHPRYDDVQVGRAFATEEFEKDGQYINLIDPNKGMKTNYSPRKNFDVAAAQVRKQEGIQMSQENKEYSIKVASTFSNAVLITVELMKEDKLAEWHTLFMDVRSWLWNHFDMEKPEEPTY